MKALIQRVSSASVSINDEAVGAIGQGILLLLGIDKNDTHASADKLLQKVLNYRIFADQDDKMNLNVQQVQGGLLIVSQFTLVADTRKGLRPSFSSGADPQRGEELYNYFIDQAQIQHLCVSTGRFGADMQVQLTNDGPVTFLIET